MGCSEGKAVPPAVARSISDKEAREKSGPVVRLVSYSCKVGMLIKYKEMIRGIDNFVTGECVEEEEEELAGSKLKALAGFGSQKVAKKEKTNPVKGLMTVVTAMPDPEHYFLFVRFANQEYLNDYKNQLKELFRNQASGVMERRVLYDNETALKFEQVQTGGMVKALIYRCAPGQQRVWGTICSEFDSTVKKGGITGTLLAVGLQPTPLTYAVFSRFSSQEEADKYASKVRDRFHANVNKEAHSTMAKMLSVDDVAMIAPDQSTVSPVSAPSSPKGGELSDPFSPRKVASFQSEASML
mmetsp:Transcript_25396/g.55992  ORF Transcript_25396/g.55992 Transcript_25396/m.55992 type:complete len:298 (-) Transcript_25396:30-923(-)